MRGLLKQRIRVWDSTRKCWNMVVLGVQIIRNPLVDYPVLWITWSRRVFGILADCSMFAFILSSDTKNHLETTTFRVVPPLSKNFLWLILKIGSLCYENRKRSRPQILSPSARLLTPFIFVRSVPQSRRKKLFSILGFVCDVTIFLSGNIQSSFEIGWLLSWTGWRDLPESGRYILLWFAARLVIAL